MHTAHHSVALHVKSALDCIGDEDEHMPQATQEQQNSNLTRTTNESDMFEDGLSRPEPVEVRDPAASRADSQYKMDACLSLKMEEVWLSFTLQAVDLDTEEKTCAGLGEGSSAGPLWGKGSSDARPSCQCRYVLWIIVLGCSVEQLQCLLGAPTYLVHDL